VRGDQVDERSEIEFHDELSRIEMKDKSPHRCA
jgi:hypothetical protein